MKKQYTTITVVAVVVILIAAWFLTRNTETENDNVTLPSTESLNKTDHVRGNPDAAVTLIEYGDFECPACAQYHTLLQELEEKFDEDVAFVFRHFPLTSIHANAELASRAAEAAGKQDKFWEMHDMLYEKQTQWASNTDARNIFIGYAEELGLNTDTFKEDLNSKEVKNTVNTQRNSGTAAKVNATPTFFLNGSKIQNPASVAEFETLLNAAIQENANSEAGINADTETTDKDKNNNSNENANTSK